MPYKTDPIAKSFSFGEILANSITHGIGVALSIIGFVFLLVRAINLGTGWHIVGFSIFGTSLVLLYAASTLYHSTPRKSWNAVLQRLDHVAIFFLIAGTYTPFMLLKLRGALGWTVFGIMWAIAIGGLIVKLGFTSRFVKPPVWLYVAMSWLALLAFGKVMSDVGSLSLTFLLVGGVCYTAGILFFKWRKLPYSHAIWHVFVLFGSIFHYLSVFNLVSGS